VDGIVVNSRAVARELAEDGVPASMVRLAYNGLDTTRFRREGERAMLPWSDGTPVVIGIVCALRPEKGLGILMEAFRKLKSARRGVKLMIVGIGPMLAELQAESDSDCHFEPAVGNVAPWLRAMDIFVLPSLSETLSNSLMEAMR